MERRVYAGKCSFCHGQTGTEGPAPRLVGGVDSLSTRNPVLTLGSYWPFATTVWDYINRSMPRDAEGSLTPDQVYAVTAFLLYKNDIVKETDVLDAKTLVESPNAESRRIFSCQAGSHGEERELEAELESGEAGGSMKTPTFTRISNNRRCCSSCSARLQAGTLGAIRCPPEGGRYMKPNRVLTQTL